MPKTANRYNRRPGKSQKRKKPGSRPKQARSAKSFRPRINPDLKSVLGRIGTPEDSPFSPDPFQVEAIEKVDLSDVIVSAPTGSGKTYIAEKAIDRTLKKGGRVWYASPLKALSNNKFSEFRELFGSDQVGLLTGDLKINPDAAVIVGTTEILRNQLYDGMNQGSTMALDLVVLDEAHYLGDEQRGVVWEEVIIYLPARIRLLLLSATISNAGEIAAWLENIRGQEAVTIVSRERPVPLYPLFLFPDGELAPLTKGRNLYPKIRAFTQKNDNRGRFRGREQAPIGRTVRVLDQADLIPAIFFLKSRADCDMALTRCFDAAENHMAEHGDRLKQRLIELLEKYPFLKNHKHIHNLMETGTASHHAGHLPHWKLIIEQLMQEGLLAAIFSTSTVAAGVNFPARTVVVPQSDRFNGQEFVELSAMDLQQMTGRAGRRGMDQIGFTVFIPGPFMNIQHIHSVLQASSEPVKSRILINFSMTLNLLISHKPEDVKPLLDLSLAAFQESRPEPKVRAAIEKVESQLEKALEGGLCKTPDKGFELFKEARGLINEIGKLTRSAPRRARHNYLTGALVPGRLFERKDGSIFVALKLETRRDRNGVLAVRMRPDRLIKNGSLRTKWISLDRVSLLFETVIDLRPEMDVDTALVNLRQALGQVYPPMAENRNKGDHTSDEKEHLNRLKDALDKLLCSKCLLAEKCVDNKKGAVYRLFIQLNRMKLAALSQSQAIWNSFNRHLDFLRQENFISGDELTREGEWAAQLRLDHPLVIAEAIRAGVWPKDNPVLLAGMVAPLVVDKDRDILKEKPLSGMNPELSSALARLEKAVTPIIKRLKEKEFDTPSMFVKPALAIYYWAGGGKWEEAVETYGLDQGDMAMLVFRTADNLRQIASLSDNHPELARSAREARDLILKEPVIIPI